MTSVTEAAKRSGEGRGPLDQADLTSLRADPVLAQQFARRLAAVARDLVPNAALSVEDLRDLLELAVQGSGDSSLRIVEGRYLRKRVREQCAFAERYGEPFALVVVKLRPEPRPGLYLHLMEGVVEKLRRSDMVTVYRRRVAMLLPRMRSEVLGGIVGRIHEQLDAGAGAPVVEAMERLVYPSDRARETQFALDWLEDELRVQ